MLSQNRNTSYKIANIVWQNIEDIILFSIERVVEYNLPLVNFLKSSKGQEKIWYPVIGTQIIKKLAENYQISMIKALGYGNLFIDEEYWKKFGKKRFDTIICSDNEIVLLEMKAGYNLMDMLFGTSGTEDRNLNEIFKNVYEDFPKSLKIANIKRSKFFTDSIWHDLMKLKNVILYISNKSKYYSTGFILGISLIKTKDNIEDTIDNLIKKLIKKLYKYEYLANINVDYKSNLEDKCLNMCEGYLYYWLAFKVQINKT